jgi:hypothetical protein
MPSVSWSDQAESNLENLVLAVADQLRGNAEEILHEIPPLVWPADEGAAGGIMWHRGAAHERFPEQANDPQNYFLFYRPLDPGEFQVLAVGSIHHLASKWVQMSKESAGPPL